MPNPLLYIQECHLSICMVSCPMHFTNMLITSGGLRGWTFSLRYVCMLQSHGVFPSLKFCVILFSLSFITQPPLIREKPQFSFQYGFKVEGNSLSCVHFVFHKLFTHLWFLTHAIPFLSPWFQFPQETAHWVLLSAEASLELKAEPHLVIQREKRRPVCDVIEKWSGPTPTTLAYLWEAKLLGNRCYGDIYQSALIMGFVFA